MDYVQAVDFLYSIPKFTHEPSTIPAKALLCELGSPEKGMKVIHVAGTNGKGSVCAYMSSALQCAGRDVGLFTSPHLVHMEERIRINGKNISEDMFLEAFLEVKRCEKRLESKFGRLSFFEYFFGMAMYCFDKAGVEYAVLETGLGGRLDATNAIDKPAITIITPVSLDHVSVLGDTLEAIAHEKAGIIKDGVPVVYWAKDEAVRGVIENVAKEKHAEGHALGTKNYEILQINDKSVDFCPHNMYHENCIYSVPFTALYQAENALLAIEALGLLGKTDLSITQEATVCGIKKTFWQGRFEEVSEGVIVDGAHNEAGILSFIEAVSTREKAGFKGKKYLLFAVMKDKDYHTMIELICKRLDFETIILTKSGKDRGLSLELMCKEFEKHTDRTILTIDDWREALEKGKSFLGKNDTLYCVGSLYLVGAILEEYGR